MHWVPWTLHPRATLTLTLALGLDACPHTGLPISVCARMWYTDTHTDTHMCTVTPLLTLAWVIVMVLSPIQPMQWYARARSLFLALSICSLPFQFFLAISGQQEVRLVSSMASLEEADARQGSDAEGASNDPQAAIDRTDASASVSISAPSADGSVSK